VKKGFIITQIDGLGFGRLKKAIKEGNAPFFKNLIEKKGYKLEKMYCGVPPLRLQTGIMYGRYDNMPGLVWFNKENGKISSVVRIEELRRLEKEWGRGLLSKGVAIGTILSGGSESCGSLSSFTLDVLLKNFSKLEITFYIILAPFILLTSCLASLIFRIRKEIVFEGLFLEWIFRRYTLKLAKRKIREGVPFLYINFGGNDSRSHQTGPDSYFTSRVIKKIDKAIEKIYIEAGESERIEYDFFVLSDHGQIESIPFEDCFNETFKEFIERELKTEVIDGRNFLEIITTEQSEDMINKIWWLKAISWPIKILAKKYYLKLGGSFDKKNLILLPQGEIAHIYLNSNKEKVKKEEIEERFPGFLDSLVKHEGISFILVSSEKGVEILGKEGRVLLGAEEKIEGKDPLGDSFDREYIIGSIKRFIEMKKSGDVIVFSSKKDGKAIGFVPEVSCHAGIDKEVQEIFVINSSSKFSFEGIKDQKTLYKFFINYIK